MSVELKNKERKAWDLFLSCQETFKRESDKPYSFGILWTYVYRRNFEAIMKLMGGVRQKTILDIGCGGGWLSEWLTLEGATAVGLDISFEFCRVSKERSKKRGTGISYVCADGESLPFKKNSFDASIAYQSLHHLPNPEKAIGEALRISKTFILGDEPARILLPDFPIRLLKILSLSNLHVGELSGIEQKRFNPLELREKFRESEYSVKYERQWSVVPTFFSKTEKYNVMRAVYKTIHRILMGIRPIRNVGHGLTMIIERKQQESVPITKTPSGFS